MSEFKDELVKTLENVYETAKEYGAYAKIQALIAAQESKKQELYYRLGKKYYELYKDAPASDLSEIMNKLLTCDDKIEEYRQVLKDSQDAKYTDVSEPEEAKDCTESNEDCCAESKDESKEESIKEPEILNEAPYEKASEETE